LNFNFNIRLIIFTTNATLFACAAQKQTEATELKIAQFGFNQLMTISL